MFRVLCPEQSSQQGGAPFQLPDKPLGPEDSAFSFMV